MGELSLTACPAWQTAGPIIAALTARGFNALIVGGAVRDMVLGRVPRDLDILTNARPHEILALFPGSRNRCVGRTFAITLVNGVEVASCRSLGNDPGFPGTDLGMRDLTINAMAWDPFSRKVLDPFGGRRDLAERTIRFTGDPGQRIQEDPVRMVRACRFAACYTSVITPGSARAIRQHTCLIRDRAFGERIRDELVKAMGLDRPSVFFRHLRETGLLAHILPCLDHCVDQDGGPHHGETVFEHCLLVGDSLPARQPLLRLAGYVHDTGKVDAARLKHGSLTFAGHETRYQALESDLERLRFSNRDQTYILNLFKAHMRPLNHESTPPGGPPASGDAGGIQSLLAGFHAAQDRG